MGQDDREAGRTKEGGLASHVGAGNEEHGLGERGVEKDVVRDKGLVCGGVDTGVAKLVDLKEGGILIDTFIGDELGPTHYSILLSTNYR